MSRRRASLGQAELEILRYVLDRHPVTVRDVAEHAAETTGHARTTVLTVMERLRKKGYLGRRKVGGVFQYRPKLRKGELLEHLIGDFVDRVLGGSVSPFVAYLAQSSDLADEELAHLKQLVRELEERQERGST
jgi:predicted transcriptional regulator